MPIVAALRTVLFGTAGTINTAVAEIIRLAGNSHGATDTLQDHFGGQGNFAVAFFFTVHHAKLIPWGQVALYHLGCKHCLAPAGGTLNLRVPAGTVSVAYRTKHFAQIGVQVSLGGHFTKQN
jgi:hypothetical protein